MHKKTNLLDFYSNLLGWVNEAQVVNSRYFCWGHESDQPLLDAELAWYSLSATCWICVYGLEHSLKINGF